MNDLISRQAAIDELHGKDPSQIWDTADIEVWLNTLPSAQPERKTGKWRPFGLGDWQCSECNAYVYNATVFCPNCGADMRGEGHE